MEELKKQVIKKNKEDLSAQIERLNVSSEKFNNMLSCYGRKYQGTEEQQKQKFIKYLTKKNAETNKKELAQIDEVNQAEDFKDNLYITVEWKKSYMWGSNPTASTNRGFNGSSIGGCGYCKRSTATAQALNSDNRILKLLYKAKNEYLKALGDKGTIKENRESLGYGSGYNTIPKFEGGVGVGSHETILYRLGLKMEQVSNAPSTDVYIIRLQTEEDQKRGY